jgi:glucose/arabinose dehydrogenase
MAIRQCGIALVAALSTVVAQGHAGSAPSVAGVRLTTGLSGPLYVTHAPGDFERIFIVEKTGRIKIFKNGAVNVTPFLNLSGSVNAIQSQGLHSLAFHPDYQKNGKFYVIYRENSTNPGDAMLVQYEVSANPDVADASSASVIMRIEMSDETHSGGWMGFGPDGYLWIPFGDGGEAPHDRPQDIEIPYGKILRIDVNGPDAFPEDPDRNFAIPQDNPFVDAPGLDEIYALGIRQPWRSSFDRATGDFYIANVGRSGSEEIDFLPAGSPSPVNFGWPCMEGTLCPKDLQKLAGCVCNDASLTLPIHEYDHTQGCAIIGGFVYRGCAIPDLQGYYIFADFCFNTIFALKHDGAQVTDLVNITALVDPPGPPSTTSIGGFGEDAYGEIYICEVLGGGDLVKIIPNAAVALIDCNLNGAQDACDIADGTSLDVNDDGIPDECGGTCPADLNGDTQVNGADLGELLLAWTADGSKGGCDDPCPADLNDDGVVNGADLGALLLAWGECK